MAFQKAVRTKAKLRLALCGPSGSGKSYTALRLAMALAGPNGRVAVLDTERGSASLYAGQFDPDDRVAFEFDVSEPADYTPATFVRSIREAADGGYEVLVLDSITHAWEGVKAEADKGAARKAGNTWAGWADARPQEKAMLDAMLQYPGHVIATMRVKTVWEVGESARGKKTYQKIGLAPEQKAGIEYEFTVTMDLDTDHQGVVTKSRCSAVADAVIQKPGAPFAKTLLEWLDGAPVAPTAPTPKPATQANGATQRTPQEDLRAAIWTAFKRIAPDRTEDRALFSRFAVAVCAKNGKTPKELTDGQAREAIKWLKEAEEEQVLFLLRPPPAEPAPQAPEPPASQAPSQPPAVPLSVLQNELSQRVKTCGVGVKAEQKLKIFKHFSGGRKMSELSELDAGRIYAAIRATSDADFALAIQDVLGMRGTA